MDITATCAFSRHRVANLNVRPSEKLLGAVGFSSCRRHLHVSPMAGRKLAVQSIEALYARCFERAPLANNISRLSHDCTTRGGHTESESPGTGDLVLPGSGSTLIRPQGARPVRLSNQQERSRRGVKTGELKTDESAYVYGRMEAATGLPQSGFLTLPHPALQREPKLYSALRVSDPHRS